MSSNIVQTNSLEDSEIGECQLHQRPNECFCTTCHVIICPSCLMFEPHKGHAVCKIEEAANELRNQMDDAAKTGLFKVENTENILLDLRHIKLTCDEAKQKILVEVEQTFTSLIKQLKIRKNEVIKEIEEHFNEEIEKLQTNEEKWMIKQEACLNLINYVKSGDDLKIIKNANKILDSIQNLKEPLNYETVNLINNLNTNLFLGKEKSSSSDLTLKEFLKSLQRFVKKGEVITMQYRC